MQIPNIQTPKIREDLETALEINRQAQRIRSDITGEVSYEEWREYRDNLLDVYTKNFRPINYSPTIELMPYGVEQIESLYQQFFSGIRDNTLGTTEPKNGLHIANDEDFDEFKTMYKVIEPFVTGIVEIDGIFFDEARKTKRLAPLASGASNIFSQIYWIQRVIISHQDYRKLSEVFKEEINRRYEDRINESMNALKNLGRKKEYLLIDNNTSEKIIYNNNNKKYPY